MKRILITGVNSYVGNAVAEYLSAWNKVTAAKNHQMANAQNQQKTADTTYHVEKLSLRDATWKDKSFAEYDTIFHMVGIAHADVEHVSEETKQRYYDINCDLAVEVAKKAKQDGVKQFVYMSSVILYGDSAKVGQYKNIKSDTIPAPANFYGDSKLSAEQELIKIAADDFQVAFVRSPMIYGKNSKGNYRTLEKMTCKLPIFPSIRNERSMIYIENLAEFLRLLAESGRGGVYFPQNAEWVSTADMVKEIAMAKGKKVRLCSLLNPFVRLGSCMPGKPGKLINKAFGNLTIDKELSVSQGITDYQKYSLQESIRRIHEN